MNHNICFFFVICFIFLNLAKAQKTTPTESDLSWDWYSKSDTAAILSAQEHEKIAQFVQQEYVRFLVVMYEKKYNIDSLFPDSISHKLFLRNPFIAQYPQLREYEYRPIFHRISNIKMNACNEFCYLKNVYEIIKFNYFIRPGNPSLGILADSLYQPCEANAINLDEETSVTDMGRCFAVYYEKSKPLRMVGGSAFLDGFPYVKISYDEYTRGV